MTALLRRQLVGTACAGLVLVLTAGPAAAGTRVTGDGPGGTRVTDRDLAVPLDPSTRELGTRVTDRDLAVPVDMLRLAGTRVTSAAAEAGALAGTAG